MTHCTSYFRDTTDHSVFLSDIQPLKSNEICLFISVCFLINGLSICPLCWSFAMRLGASVYVCMYPCTAGHQWSHVFTFAFIFFEVFAHSLSVTVISVARLGNQILFIASGLFQHITIMINRETGVV